MSYNCIKYKKVDNVAWITLNRPEKMNALNLEMIKEWRCALIDSSQDKAVGVVVVTGAGRAYCSGLDLMAVKGDAMSNGSVPARYDELGHALIDTMQNIPKVVISMVNGVCITGGLEVALASDLIVASEDAMFRDSHAFWGMRPSWGMSQRLPRAVGLMRARELSLTARFFSAGEAWQMGLVNRVVPADRLREETLSLAGTILNNSLESVAAIKHLYKRGFDKTLQEGLKMEKETRFIISDTQKRLENFYSSFPSTGA
ncbi:MAG: enoyl-CoA hydratase-related protein [Desulfobacterium sp.]